MYIKYTIDATVRGGFSPVYDVESVIHASNALNRDVKIAMETREKGITSSFEVEHYSPDEPHGFILTEYKNGAPYRKTVCQPM